MGRIVRVALVAALAAFAAALALAAPQQQRVQLPRKRANAEIIWTTDGVPHITADDLEVLVRKRERERERYRAIRRKREEERRGRRRKGKGKGKGKGREGEREENKGGDERGDFGGFRGDSFALGRGRGEDHIGKRKKEEGAGRSGERGRRGDRKWSCFYRMSSKIPGKSWCAPIRSMWSADKGKERGKGERRREGAREEIGKGKGEGDLI